MRLVDAYPEIHARLMRRPPIPEDLAFLRANGFVAAAGYYEAIAYLDKTSPDWRAVAELYDERNTPG